MGKVLIVEDSKPVASAVRMQIEASYGHSLVMTEDFKTTQGVLEAQVDDIDVAIVDINLPDAPDGEAVDLVLSYRVPVIVFTGQLKTSLQDDILSKGIADYTLKEGQHNVEYVAWMANRIIRNLETKVLIVDDSKTARNMMSQFLRVQRFKVLQAGDGEEALAVLEDHPDTRVVIADAYMDGVDGFELCTKIRGKYAKDELFIVGVSGASDKKLATKFIKSGANDFLLKPFEPEEFFCRVNHAAETVDLFYELKELNIQKNKILGMAAHDIRGPLGIINKAATFAAEDNVKPEKREKLLKMIVNNSAEMLELLNSLLSASAIEGGKITLDKSSVNFAILVNDRINLYESEAVDKSIEIIRDVQNAPIINVDSARIRQAVDNLITNAIKYSPQNTTISISLVTENRVAMLKVSDQGPGIMEGEIDKLFSPYEKLSSKTTAGESSTGLGLAITKNVVEAHGGAIKYEPAEGGGSSFQISLPF